MIFTDRCSFYFSLFEDRPVEMALEEFVGYIRDVRWKTQIEEYQRLMAAGETKTAKKLKNKLPGMVIAGRCEGTHAEEHLAQLSGDAMFDADHSRGRALEFLQALKQLSWVKAGWRSVSYDGIKIVVRLEAETKEEYALAYAIVAWHITQSIDFPCDMACKNITRACYASHDTEAFFKSDAEVFPWRAFVREHPEQVKQILAELNVKQPGEEKKTGECPAPASGILRTFFNEFLAHNPFMDGKKNDFLLKLGRAARYKGVTDEELNQLKALAVERLAGADCSAEDIPPRIDSGYRYADVNGMPQNPSAGDHKDQGPSLRNPGTGKGDEDADNEKLESDKLRREVSCFPDELFDRLPDFLKRGLRSVRNKRERDILLMSMITNISGCLPGVRMLYGQIHYSADLYFVALAGAGRGKGVMQLAAILPNAIQNYYNELNKKEEREYEKKKLEWDLEERLAAQGKRVPDLDKRPEPLVKHILKVSPNISKSQLIIALEESGPIGVVMNASELDAVSSAMSRDYGKHDDVLRAVFHHEEVSSYFKTDKRLIVATEPHMALCASGTPGQLRKFVSSLEDGMYTRIGFYIGQAPWVYKSAAPGKDRVDSRVLFGELGEELLRKFIFLSHSPTEVCFTEKQWREHTERFRTYLREVISEDDDSPGAIVLRHGLIAARIAMVLTALRKCEPEWNIKEWICTDEDFHTAMQIVDILLEHSLLLSTSMGENPKEARFIKPFFRIRPVLGKMPVVFSYSEFLNAAREVGIPSTSAKRYLLRLQEYQILVKEEDKYKKTGLEWPGKP